MRAAVARAADGPAPTLVINGTHLGRGVRRQDLVELALPIRAKAAAQRPDVGPKTIVILSVTDNHADLAFFQGLQDGSIDPTITVCVNSAACAMAIARDAWYLLPPGVLAARMDGRTFGFEEEVSER